MLVECVSKKNHRSVGTECRKKSALFYQHSVPDGTIKNKCCRPAFTLAFGAGKCYLALHACRVEFCDDTPFQPAVRPMAHGRMRNKSEIFTVNQLQGQLIEVPTNRNVLGTECVLGILMNAVNSKTVR